MILNDTAKWGWISHNNMEWKEQAIILGTRRHGETSAIVEVMTRNHGRHMGVVKGGRSRKMTPILQPGNYVEAAWWARLDEHLGNFKVEAIDFHASQMMLHPEALYALQLVAAHLRLLPERDPHPTLFDILQLLMKHYDNALICAELLVRFELHLLEELGFGLDLTSCAATQARTNLTYVSPKSARAVSTDAGLPWQDKLLKLPPFLLQNTGRPIDFFEIQQGFTLTGFFLHRHVWEARGMDAPSIRNNFLQTFKRHL